MKRDSDRQKELKPMIDAIVASLIEEGSTSWHIQDSAERYARNDSKHPHVSERRKKIIKFAIRCFLKILTK